MQGAGVELEGAALAQQVTQAALSVGGRLGAVLVVGGDRLDQRLADMENMKLDVMAISCAPQQFYYMVDPGLGAESCQIINDGIAAAVKAHPSRFAGIGTVPLQDTDLAIKELERCVNDLDFRSIQIGCRVRDEELSAERLEPFWARCEALDVLVFLHPSSFESPRLREHYQANIVGNPLQSENQVLF